MNNDYSDLLDDFHKMKRFGIYVTTDMQLRIQNDNYDVTYGDAHSISKIELFEKQLYKTSYMQKCLRISFDDCAPTYVGHFANIEKLIQAYKSINIINQRCEINQIVLIDQSFFNKDMSELKKHYINLNTLDRLFNDVQVTSIVRQLEEKLSTLNLKETPSTSALRYGDSLFRFNQQNDLAPAMEWIISPFVPDKLIDLGVTPKMLVNQLISNKF